MNQAPSAAEMEAVLGALVPPDVALVVWSPALAGDVLGPRERDAVARAVPKRVVEFARGRACAREALRRVGHRAEGPAGASGSASASVATSKTGPPGFVEIPVGRSREPVWPEGFTGSITHCDGFVAAVAARVGTVRGIGLDGEVDRPLPEGVAGQVITPEEANDPSGSRHDQVLRFSAKESIHKALFPLTGVWLDFLDVVLELDAGAFRARPAAAGRASTLELERLEGRYARLGGLVVTVGWAP